MQNALELRKVGFAFSSLASSHLLTVTVLHKQAAELEVLLLCRSISDCRIQELNSAAHLSSRCTWHSEKHPLTELFTLLYHG